MEAKYKIVSILGTFVLIGIALLLSENRKKVNYNLVFWGFSLQVVFAMIIFWTRYGKIFFEAISKFFVTLLGFTQDGSNFVFGPFANFGDMAKVFGVQYGFNFAFQALPTIIFFSSFMAILYHIGIMQFIVSIMAKVMTKFMKVSGAEALSVAANIFVGQTEAPLVVRPYIDTMTRSELMALMTGGMATIAGGVMAAYVTMLGGSDPELQVKFATHLLAASVMSAPAAFVMAKIMVPETEVSKTAGDIKVKFEKIDANVIDAAARGAGEGLTLALNVAAMLLAFIAIVSLINYLIGGAGNLIGAAMGTELHLTLEKILGWVLAPLAWVMGTPWEEAEKIGSLYGVKVVLNEFVAYANLAEMKGTLSPRAMNMAIYGLCGFANFGSIAIQIGGIGSLAPSRRHELARFGMKSMIAGTLACFMTATIAGILL